eukprot:SAG11_NODE_10248_length_844_cov_1.183893_1_plen_226_part_10
MDCDALAIQYIEREIVQESPEISQASTDSTVLLEEKPENFEENRAESQETAVRGNLLAIVESSAVEEQSRTDEEERSHEERTSRSESESESEGERRSPNRSPRVRRTLRRDLEREVGDLDSVFHQSTRKALKMDAEEYERLIVTSTDEDVQNRLKGIGNSTRPPKELAWPRITRTYTGKNLASFSEHMIHYNNAAPFVDDKYRCSHWMQSLSIEIQNNVLVTFQAK